MITQKYILFGVFIFCCVSAIIVSCLPTDLEEPGIPTQAQEPSPTIASKDPGTPTLEPSQPVTSIDCERVSVANPASTYCALLGYSNTFIDTPKGQTGGCILPDGLICEEWEFFSGKCGEEYSYCAQQGDGVMTLDDGQDPYSLEYAVCIDEQGHIIGSATELSGLADILAECGSN